jgi:hypothetical protein
LVKEDPISVRLDTEVKAALVKAARDDDRPLSSFINKVMRDYLKKAGYLKKG